MISYPITLDGQNYPHIHVVELKRRFVVTDTDLTERVQNGEINRDVLGTFYNYSAVIDSDDAFPAEYDAFYDVISSTDESHDLVVPFAQTTLAFKAYVTNGEDDLLAMMERQNRWGNLTFNFVACAPQRRPT